MTAPVRPHGPAEPDLVGLAGQIAAAYVTGHHLPVGDVPHLLRTLHGALGRIRYAPRETAVQRPSEAQIRDSIRPDRLISFEDGRPYKALRRHLSLRDLTPEAYRAKWGLPVDYPMVSAEYSARRSTISKAAGLGIRRPAGAA